jgi:hypothetical protein
MARNVALVEELALVLVQALALDLIVRVDGDDENNSAARKLSLDHWRWPLLPLLPLLPAPPELHRDLLTRQNSQSAIL